MEYGPTRLRKPNPVSHTRIQDTELMQNIPRANMTKKWTILVKYCHLACGFSSETLVTSKFLWEIVETNNVPSEMFLLEKQGPSTAGTLGWWVVTKIYFPATKY